MQEEAEASEVVAVLPDMARAVADRAEAAKADAPVLLVEVRWRVARATKRRLSMVTLMRNRKNEPNCIRTRQCSAKISLDFSAFSPIMAMFSFL